MTLVGKTAPRLWDFSPDLVGSLGILRGKFSTVHVCLKLLLPKLCHAMKRQRQGLGIPAPEGWRVET